MISKLLDAEERHPQAIHIPPKNVPFVEYEGHKIYKSTLVAELNGNLFLSKYSRTWVRNVVHFNNNDAYFDASLCSSRIVGPGSDVEIYFVQCNSGTIPSIVKIVMKRKRA